MKFLTLGSFAALALTVLSAPSVNPVDDLALGTGDVNAVTNSSNTADIENLDDGGDDTQVSDDADDTDDTESAENTDENDDSMSAIAKRQLDSASNKWQKGSGNADNTGNTDKASAGWNKGSTDKVGANNEFTSGRGKGGSQSKGWSNNNSSKNQPKKGRYTGTKYSYRGRTWYWNNSSDVIFIRALSYKPRVYYGQRFQFVYLYFPGFKTRWNSDPSFRRRWDSDSNYRDSCFNQAMGYN